MSPNLVNQFGSHLERLGHQLMPTKSQWEVLRWRPPAGDTVNIMYQRKNGVYSFSALNARMQWEEFVNVPQPNLAPVVPIEHKLRQRQDELVRLLTQALPLIDRTLPGSEAFLQHLNYVCKDMEKEENDQSHQRNS